MKKLPETLINTKILLDGYTELREQLNGQCSESLCPKDLIDWSYGQNEIGLSRRQRRRLLSFCFFCKSAWNSPNHKPFSHRVIPPCPCCSTLTAYQVFTRLDEVIYLLQEKLKKEYSS